MRKLKRFLRFFVFVMSSLANFKDTAAIISFLFNPLLSIPFRDRVDLVKSLYLVSYAVDCPHTQSDVLSHIVTILTLPETVTGCVVEAGCYKGGSTAKFSLAAKAAKRELIIFDSFEGIPEHNEPHRKNIYGKPVTFSKGEYCGTLSEVKGNVALYGHTGPCTFVKGWFQDTLPNFNKPIATLYIDVDLASSVKSCLKYLYPKIVEGGTLYCHDGHLPLVIEVFSNESFWLQEIGSAKPEIEGLGKQKLIRIVKRSACQSVAA